MIFWILVAALSAAVAYYVTRPLLTVEKSDLRTTDSDLAVYKDQLSEIDGELARGVISAPEAEAARLEVSRRLLRTADTAASTSKTASPLSVRPLYVGALLAIPLLTLALYLNVGTPGLPGRPLQERLAVAPESATTTDLIAKVEARLREHPEDGKGWDVIAPVYASQGQFAEAAEAYAKALKLLGATPKRLEGFAVSETRAANGVVSPMAKKALEQALEIEPKRFEARMWLALAKEQDGKTADAVADYRALLAEVPEAAPVRQALEARIRGLEKGAANDATANTADAGALSSMKAEERAMVEKMVGGLAARLKANGNDLPGWLKLMRALKVMGRDKEAAEAMGEARKQFASDAEALGQIDSAAKDLGLGS